MKRKPYKAKTLSGAQSYVRTLLRQVEDARRLLDQYHADRKLLAKLAANGPMFVTPMEARQAEKVAETILEELYDDSQAKPFVLVRKTRKGER